MPYLPRYTGGLGDALQSGVQGFVAGRANRRADQQFEQDMADRLAGRTIQRAQLASQGVHLLGPGELPPADLLRTISADAGNAAVASTANLPSLGDLAPRFDPSTGQNTNTPTTRAGAGAGNIPGRSAPPPAAPAASATAQDPSGDFRTILSGMMGGPVARGPRFEFGQGYYVDHTPQWQQQDIARSQKMSDQFVPLLVDRMVKADDRNRKMQQYVSAGVSPERAALYVDNPELANNDPKFGKPHTDPMQEMNPEKFNLNGRPVQGFTDKRGNYYDATGQKITGQIAPYVAPPSAETQALRDIAIGDRRTNQQNQTKDKILDDFARDTKKFDDVMAGWEVMNGALKNPGMATPFALADAYARISNPGAIVRPSTMQMIDDLGSLDQRVRKFASHNINGQLPPDVTRDLVNTIAGMVAEHKKTFDATRAQALTRAKQAGISDLDPILRNFEFQMPTTGGKPGGPIDPGGNIDLRGDTSVNPFAALVPKKTP